MTWVSGSLSAEEDALRVSTVNNYAGQRILNIGDMIVPGADVEDVFIFRATARFDMDAQTGPYGSSGHLNYSYLVNDEETPGHLQSCDRYKGCGFATVVEAAGNPADRIIPIETKITAARSCYKPNEETTFTIEVKNPNTAVTFDNVSLDISHSEFPFTLVGNITSSTLLIGTPVLDGGDPVDGSYTFGPFNIPPGTHTITFKLKTPAKASLPIDEYDEEGEPIYAPLVAGFEFNSESDDICISSAIEGADGLLELPYCTAKTNIIVNKNVSTRLKK
jgi:hypothetical protein